MDTSVLMDFSLRCKTCKSYFALSNVLNHQKHHRAMRILRFKEGKGPRNIDSLSKRHMMICQKVLAKYKEDPTDPSLIKRIEKINDAYDTLRFEFTKDDSRLKSMLVQEGMTSMRDGYFDLRDKVEDDQVMTHSVMTSKESGFPQCVSGIGHSEAVNKDWRDQMEDRVSVVGNMPSLSLQENDGSCYIGLFDGHHGSSAADNCTGNMHRIIAEEIVSKKHDLLTNPDVQIDLGGSGDALLIEDKGTFLSNENEKDHENPVVRNLTDSQMSKCLSRSYMKMDEYLGHGINEKSRLRWSGCSALTCMIADSGSEQDTKMNNKGDGQSQMEDNDRLSNKTGSSTAKNKEIGKLFISHAGNVQAVMYHKKKPYILSQTHTLENSKERRRVMGAGGTITQSERHARINGVLSCTRGLGNHGDPQIKKCVLFEPHTSMARITNETQLVVIASNSLWEVFNPNDVFSILINSLHEVGTGLWKGPTPIIPVMHGHYRGDSSDTLQHQAGMSSTLPSIVETEEDEEIEEVIFVEAQDSDSDEDEIEEEIVSENAESSEKTSKNGAGNTSDSSLPDSKLERQRKKKDYLKESRKNDEDSSSSSHGINQGCRKPGRKQEEYALQEKHANLAQEMSEQLVRATLCAGAVENISVAVVLFKGMFSF